MTVRINTTEYEFSHGRKPRGDGAWAFAYRRDADMAEIFWINGFYVQAKKVAVAKAKAEGQHQVFILP